MWFVYALYNSEINKVYIGQTGNLERRIEEHNLKEGNHFTAKLKEVDPDLLRVFIVED